MRRLHSQVLSLLIATVLGGGLGGCASQSNESLRLREELGRARAEATWQQARAAELEARVSRLEQRAVTTPNTSRTEDRELLNRLERLLAMNERLLAERERADDQPAASAPGTAAPALSKPVAATPDDDARQLRALVERLRGHPGSPHGGLSREQENALRVLTRPERQLDTANPWRADFY
ncbi:MAG TPA: hypothetical protein VFK05_29975 [Polyangiaceae bacterium]|nr:hypothetical protein [Polyangiaceae bacterium]